MSDLLKRFLQSWIDWIDAGAPQGEPFSRNTGLCANVYDWTIECDLDIDAITKILRELRKTFRADNLHPMTPFGGNVVYLKETETATQHLNAERLAWVRSKVKQHETA
jgi:hypothetical protein